MADPNAKVETPVVTPDPKVVTNGTPPPTVTKTGGSDSPPPKAGDQEVSLLDGADGAKKIGGDLKADDKGKTGDAPKGGAPEKYALTIPKESLLSAVDLPRIEALARTRGLTQEAAQAFVEAQSELLTEDAKAEKERFAQLQKTWVDTIKTDATLGNAKLGDSMETVKRYVEDSKKFPPGLKKILVDSGLHNHPEVFRFLHGLALEGKNDKAVVPPGGGPVDSKVKALSPDQRMEAMYAARDAAERARSNVVTPSE